MHEVVKQGGVNVASVSPAQWTWRSGAVTTYDKGNRIGVDADPTISGRSGPLVLESAVFPSGR